MIPWGELCRESITIAPESCLHPAILMIERLTLFENNLSTLTSTTTCFPKRLSKLSNAHQLCSQVSRALKKRGAGHGKPCGEHTRPRKPKLHLDANHARSRFLIISAPSLTLLLPRTESGRIAQALASSESGPWENKLATGRRNITAARTRGYGYTALENWTTAGQMGCGISTSHSMASMMMDLRARSTRARHRGSKLGVFAVRCSARELGWRWHPSVHPKGR
ncbi:hypothetical protein BCR34DRAFT_217624 [Clohesyomyces aquaticus]|uniref:Uncharacterized protein n=1 Tax=Clohesyomyces aquaticus TaxID=1231657 RepID=A0A1Y1Y9P8_9PLEO|nr:hypothetical protein BCR34DRAFT_217624 [Clohesyomyces aquaticus]